MGDGRVLRGAPITPPTEAKGGRRMLEKGRGIKTARKHVATPALSHFHWRKQDGGNKKLKKRRNFNALPPGTKPFVTARHPGAR